MPALIHSTSELQFRANLQLHPSPANWRDQFIYFLLVDRFDDNATNVPAYHAGIATGRDAAQGGRFQGGNLRGVMRRLDYIQGLGCTAIWLSPILKNRAADNSYHGYGIQNFLEVDPHFGTLRDLQDLVRAAHERGMYVIMDMVLNHAGDVWQYPGGYPYYYNHGETFPFGGWREQNPAPGLQDDDGVWPTELQQPDAFKRHGEIRDWNDRVQARDGDFLSLKELNLPRADVLDTLIKVYKHWVDAADVDGFRVDTVKHMEDSSVAIFCNAIREYAQRVGKQRFFLFGEIMDSDDTIQRYIGRNSRIEGTNERFPSLDAALDFPLYFVLEQVIKGFASPAFLRDRYESFRTRYADHGEAGRYFVTFVDNHDRKARFLHDNPYPEQALLAMGYLLTSQGVPCIYYGTEQGLDGGGDSDAYVRECIRRPVGRIRHHGAPLLQHPARALSEHPPHRPGPPPAAGPALRPPVLPRDLRQRQRLRPSARARGMHPGLFAHPGYRGGAGLPEPSGPAAAGPHHGGPQPQRAGRHHAEPARSAAHGPGRGNRRPRPCAGEPPAPWHRDHEAHVTGEASRPPPRSACLQVPNRIARTV